MIFTVRAAVPSLNDYIRAERSNRFIAAKLKADIQDRLGWELKPRPEKPLETVADLTVAFILKDRRKDWDNVMFGLKFIQDALVEARILKDDSPAWLNPPRVLFGFDASDPRIIIRLEPGEPFPKAGNAEPLMIAAEYAARFR